MSVESDFEDTVKICEFYADPYEEIDVDYENNIIVMGVYTIDPLIEKGVLIEYLVRGPDGKSHLVWDLDAFFQRVFGWKER
jgi:hypothetical protein